MSIDGGAPKGRILVVDDDIDDDNSGARMLVELLCAHDYDVEEAPGFARVEELISQESFDLVMLDIDMPGKDGLEVLAWLREHHPDTGVVMATGQDDVDKVVTAMQLGAYDYLLKPFNIDLVTAGVARAMERQRLLAENRSYQRDLEQKVESRTAELREANRQLAFKVRELDGRDRLMHFQMWEHTKADAYEEILEVTADVLGVPRVILYRPEDEGQLLIPVGAWGTSTAGKLESEEGLAALARAGDDSDAAVRAFRDGQPVREASGAAVPILFQDRAIGAISVAGLNPDPQQAEELCNALWRLAQAAALVISAAQVAEDLESGKLPVDQLLGLQ